MRRWRPPARSSAHIDIDIRNIFDKNDPRENSGLYRLADKLHLRTKPSTIRAQLLFKSGDRYRAQKLAETERNLRMLIYIYDAHVVPVRYADGKVDVKVITKDVWTLSPGDLLRARGRHQLHELQPARHQFPGVGENRGHFAQQQRRPHQQYHRLCGSERVRLALDLGPDPTSIRATDTSAPRSLRSPSIRSIRAGAPDLSALSFDRTVSRY